MIGTYEIFEKFCDGKLVYVERTGGLELAKMRFLSLTKASRRDYLIWDPTRGYEVVCRAAATA
jgi:hypothetical protein